MTFSKLVSFSTLLFAMIPFARAEKNPVLPPPYETPVTAKVSKVIGWPKGKMPIAPKGFAVSLFAEAPAARSLYVLPSGHVLVSQSKQSKITIYEMHGSKKIGERVFAENLNQPFGMALWGNDFYVAEPERVLRFTYEKGKLKDQPKEVAKLPHHRPKHHWTRHLLFSKDGSKLYVSVGSPSNVGEDGDPLDSRSAAILEMNRDGSGEKIFAGGLRNPVSMAWEPSSGKLWTVVNERDNLGDGLVPDYITAVQQGGFYGWPYAYWGKNEDPRQKGKRADLVAKSMTPDFSVGNHTASLGITFTAGTKIPSPFSEGALIAQHGSWNSSKLVGYKVLYVPFKKGEAMDPEQDFLTGFIANEEKGEVYGRPVASVVLADGSLLVSDDGAGKIWKVTPVKK